LTRKYGCEVILLEVSACEVTPPPQITPFKIRIAKTDNPKVIFKTR